MQKSIAVTIFSIVKIGNTYRPILSIKTMTMNMNKINAYFIVVEYRYCIAKLPYRIHYLNRLEEEKLDLQFSTYVKIMSSLNLFSKRI